MLLKAWEMGFKISPEELAQKETNRKVAESIVKQYYSKGYSPWQIFKRYNGGDKYANKAIKLYENSK
jgi:soluble lytic murein transglycosylase-like protein